jgi:membrane associated rhomboid family serine protease
VGPVPGSGRTLTGVDQPLRQATHSFVVVVLAALAFFAFVIGSGLTGAVGQSLFGLLFGLLACWYVWRHLDLATRERLAIQARRVTRRSSAER